MTVRISTIIPAYNAAPYVAQAVTSALEQSGVDNEVIAVDDGSTDGTWDVLQEFGNRIRAVRETNSGPGAARNHGARLAEGQWLAFLDADDYWLPEKLVKQLARVDDHTDLVYCDRFNVGSTDRVAGQLSEALNFPEGDVFEALLLTNFVTLSSVMMRKSRFDDLHGFCNDLDVAEDWDLWLRHAADGRLALCHEPLLCYRLHPGGISNDIERMNRFRLQVLQRALALPRGRQVSWAVQRRALAQAWECSAWFASANQRWKAIGWYLRSAYYAPFNVNLYKGIAKCCLGMR